jgi:sugar phosphate isomerase/epimerase
MTHTISRRRFLAASAAASAAAAVGGPFALRSLAGTPGGERIVPPGKLGLQQFSIRDATGRRSIANSLANGIEPTKGYLGGPNFPADPTDLGPLVNLPGGFNEVFAYLASIGYRGFEFFSFNQNINELGRQPTATEIRGYLDAAGLYGVGTHTAGLGAMYDPATGGISANGQTQIANAHILGFPIIGTAGDPSQRATLGDNPTNPNQIGWQEAARRANIVGAAAAAEGLKWYWHVEQNGFAFFNDPDHPELSQTKRLDWWNANTDPSLVFYEPDIFHAYAGRARFPYADGSLWDALGFWTTNSRRILAWHVKDGTRIVPPPAPGANPFTQVVLRPPTFAPGGPPAIANNDALYTGEGTIAQGYPVDPDPGVVGFKKIFTSVDPKGSKFYLVESDNAPGPATDLGRSLRHAKLAIPYLVGLRGSPNGGATGTEAGEEILESQFEQ